MKDQRELRISQLEQQLHVAREAARQVGIEIVKAGFNPVKTRPVMQAVVKLREILTL